MTNKFTAGTKVEHQRLGTGTVTKTKYIKGTESVVVKFDKGWIVGFPVDSPS